MCLLLTLKVPGISVQEAHALVGAVWSMTAEGSRRLAATLEAFGRAAGRPIVVEALWQGDPVKETVRLPLLRLTDLAARSQLGTATSYQVGVEDG